jgi:Icc-related predicted phosphoesterase
MISLRNTVKIIAVTDIHGRSGPGKNIEQAIASADILVCAGDITNFGGAGDAARIIKELQGLNRHLFMVHGNCDRPDVNLFLEKSGISLHGKIKQQDTVAFYGTGGSIRTPSGTPQESPEEDFETVLSRFEKDPACRFHVFVSHQPPLNTVIDRTMMGMHVGSKAIRFFIERFQPDIAVCGHIHEARGSDRIGKTIIINPGPFPAHYAEITLADGVTYTLH